MQEKLSELSAERKEQVFVLGRDADGVAGRRLHEAERALRGVRGVAGVLVLGLGPDLDQLADDGRAGELVGVRDGAGQPDREPGRSA